MKLVDYGYYIVIYYCIDDHTFVWLEKICDISILANRAIFNETIGAFKDCNFSLYYNHYRVIDTIYGIYSAYEKLTSAVRQHQASRLRETHRL